MYAICRYNDVRRYGIILVAYTISEIEKESLSQAHSFRMHTRMKLWIMEIFDRSILYLRYWIWSYYHASALSGDDIRTWIKTIEFWNKLKKKHSKIAIGTTVPIFDISCQTTDETKPPMKVLEEISSQSDLHCVSETYIYMYAIFKNAKEARTRLMTSRFNAGHIKLKVPYSAPTHLFIGENVVLHSNCTVVYVILFVSFYVLYFCKYYLLIHRLNWYLWVMGNSNAIENISCTYIILIHKTTLYQKLIPHTQMSWKSGITRYSG